MIPFQIELLRVDHVMIKSVTTALGGAIMIVDEARSTENNEVYKRVNVPMAVVRQFVKANNKISRYLSPVLSAITFYGNHAVALERHPSGRADEWVSTSERNLDSHIMNQTATGDWYIDGTYIYSFSQLNLNSAERLSADGKFKSVNVQALKLANINTDKVRQTEERTCLLYTTANGQTAMSPPIWKQLDGVGKGILGQCDDDDTTVTTDAIGIVAGNHQFDRINELLAVNLSFAMLSGKKIADVFGYDSIEPLGLDELMIQLKTVNLPRVPKAVKQTFDIGMPFTHAIAWLLGLTARTETLESYVVLRSLLKYLTTKGIYRRNSFTPDAVYMKNHSGDDVPFLSTDQALSTVRRILDKMGATPLGELRKVF